ncbi:hypothetical protein [Mycobacterium intracellulare]|uniref:Uncharacterized protein n=1 Tax=Mycobacterium intracellulare TaxID=1767 RepID=A0AAE4RB22_MYCIT|nr:hypothetical protein [Mycobacterium intracellulare]MDV6975346.1 hypothetical protein [Mycobacterium intracellulare]MDV6980410.1 hypothetical protein [Mycobacterium intracellulare]MDV7010839.1 hypothetical protein [Mycobacterium intracellulare]MDV7025745.1 hypothetical protein [Mycobacterium intracellulare]
MITPVEWAGLVAGSSVLSAAVTAVASRRPSMAKVFAENYRDVVERLAKVETRLDTVERERDAERQEHSVTKEMLRVALRWIREAVAWATGPRHTEFPPPPPELLKEL